MRETPCPWRPTAEAPRLPLQGNRIIKPLKKKRKEPTGKDWKEKMDIRTELALIPDPRIDHGDTVKYLAATVLYPLSANTVLPVFT
jgi:hypothetical protein